jgi:hypothetical protein
VSLWHYYGDTRQYCGQKVALSTTGAFNGEEVVVLPDTGLDFGPPESIDGNAVTFDLVSARYVRHWSGKSDRNSGIHFMEIDVYGEDHNYIRFDSCDSSYDTMLRVYSEDLSVEKDDCDDCGDCGVQAVMDTDLPGGEYVLVIEGYEADEGDYSVEMVCGDMDDGMFDGAIACGETVTGSTAGAPNLVGNAAGDRLYSFVMAAEGAVQFDSCDSNFDTFLRIISTQLDTELQSGDDDGDCGIQTVMDAWLPAGEYVIAVEGYESDEGDFTLVMNCPAEGGTTLDGTNIDAMFLDGSIYCGETVSGSTVSAGNLVDGSEGSSEHIYAFEVTAEMTGVTFDSCDSEFDTYLRILQDTGSQPDLANEVTGCDDCGDCDAQTVLHVDAAAAQREQLQHRHGDRHVARRSGERELRSGQQPAEDNLPLDGHRAGPRAQRLHDGRHGILAAGLPTCVPDPAAVRRRPGRRQRRVLQS